jgi:hypothetical protein
MCSLTIECVLQNICNTRRTPLCSCNSSHPPSQRQRGPQQPPGHVHVYQINKSNFPRPPRSAVRAAIRSLRTALARCTRVGLVVLAAVRGAVAQTTLFTGQTVTLLSSTCKGQTPRSRTARPARRRTAGSGLRRSCMAARRTAPGARGWEAHLVVHRGEAAVGVLISRAPRTRAHTAGSDARTRAPAAPRNGRRSFARQAQLFAERAGRRQPGYAPRGNRWGSTCSWGPSPASSSARARAAGRVRAAAREPRRARERPRARDQCEGAQAGGGAAGGVGNARRCR